MLKLFSLKNQQKDGTATDAKGGMQKKASAAQLRVTKGLVYANCTWSVLSSNLIAPKIVCH